MRIMVIAVTLMAMTMALVPVLADDAPSWWTGYPDTWPLISSDPNAYVEIEVEKYAGISHNPKTVRLVMTDGGSSFGRISNMSVGGSFDFDVMLQCGNREDIPNQVSLDIASQALVEAFEQDWELQPSGCRRVHFKNSGWKWTPLYRAKDANGKYIGAFVRFDNTDKENYSPGESGIGNPTAPVKVYEYSYAYSADNDGLNVSVPMLYAIMPRNTPPVTQGEDIPTITLEYTIVERP
jgi:hypothetical protein